MIRPLSTIVAAIEEKATTPDRLIKTGFPKIDTKYFGIAPKEIWTIGAYTGSGKTFFCLQLALNIVGSGHKICYFSMEMASEPLVARLWGNLAGVNPTKLEYQMLDLPDFQRKINAKEGLLKLSDSLFMDDQTYTVTGIKNTVRDLIKIGKKPEVCFVDFIQNIQSGEDEYKKLTDSIVDLQKFAKEVDTAFVIASQVSNAEQKEGLDSKIIGFKGSGGLAAATDFALWLEKQVDYEEKYQTFSNIDLTFRKVRRGPNAKIKLKLNFPSGRMEEAE